jgi:hypothetical protein
LVAIIELKFGKGTGDGQAKFLADLARKSLEAIKGKGCGTPLLPSAMEVAKIGVGVTTSGKCLALIG